MTEPDIHGPVSISATATFGPNCTIWQFATICDEVVLGEGVVVGSNVWIGRGCVIGDYTRIQHGAFIPNHTKIGKSVFIGPNATLTDDKHPKAGQFYRPQPPQLDDDCSIGAGAVVLPNVHIFRGVLVGAGAVVSQDVPPHTTVVGVPARCLPHDAEKEIPCRF